MQFITVADGMIKRKFYVVYHIQHEKTFQLATIAATRRLAIHNWLCDNKTFPETTWKDAMQDGWVCRYVYMEYEPLNKKPKSKNDRKYIFNNSKLKKAR